MKKIFNFLLDLIFPIECLGCNKEGVWICENCLSSIKLNKNIQKSPSDLFEGFFVALNYKDNQLCQEIIKRFKYSYIKELENSLSYLLYKYLNKALFKKIIDSNTIIIPVPLYKTRQRERGFNQSEIIAKNIAEKYGLEMGIDIIKRIRNTQSQAKLTGVHRRKNLKEAFKCFNPNIIKNKQVILVDDVFTTGSTLSEVATVLKNNGVKKIWGLVIAKSEI